MIEEAKLARLLKSGAILTVKAKNGDCIPMFHWRPDAYRCAIGKHRVSGEMVTRLLRRRVIKCVNDGWYTEGHFTLNPDLRDGRGRFKSRQAA